MPYLELYASKMRMWSIYLLSQWGVARALSIRECNTMQAEAIDLRNSHAWSVPTNQSLAAIAEHSPLIEMGAGNGVWADALRRRGADVLAFDTARFSELYGVSADEASAPLPAGCADESDALGAGTHAMLMGERVGSVQEGGPEVLAQHPERTLVLMWPDYQGRGSYGLECLSGYAGEALILVGEWRGRTYGGSLGLCEGGQSFSADFQRTVEAQFECVQEHRLPNWPLFLDTLTIWRRRGAGRTVVQR